MAIKSEDRTREKKPDSGMEKQGRLSHYWEF